MTKITTRHVAATIRDAAPGSRTFECVASDSHTIDSYDSVLAGPWNLERFALNPVVLLAHDHRKLPIGRAENVRTEGGKLLARLVISDATPEAQAAGQLMAEGVLRGVSVGFFPGRITTEQRAGRDVDVLRDLELLELSVTPLPANKHALIQRAAQFRAATICTPGEDPSDDVARGLRRLNHPAVADLLDDLEGAADVRPDLSQRARDTLATRLASTDVRVRVQAEVDRNAYAAERDRGIRDRRAADLAREHQERLAAQRPATAGDDLAALATRMATTAGGARGEGTPSDPGADLAALATEVIP